MLKIFLQACHLFSLINYLLEHFDLFDPFQDLLFRIFNESFDILAKIYRSKFKDSMFLFFSISDISVLTFQSILPCLLGYFYFLILLTWFALIRRYLGTFIILPRLRTQFIFILYYLFQIAIQNKYFFGEILSLFCFLVLFSNAAPSPMWIIFIDCI